VISLGGIIALIGFSRGLRLALYIFVWSCGYGIDTTFDDKFVH
jgi:hypothetical protein